MSPKEEQEPENDLFGDQSASQNPAEEGGLAASEDEGLAPGEGSSPLDSGPAEAGSPQANTNQTPPPSQSHPGPVQPGPVQPGSVHPGPVQPGPVQPGSVHPGPVQPGPVQPGPARPQNPFKRNPLQSGSAPRAENPRRLFTQKIRQSTAKPAAASQPGMFPEQSGPADTPAASGGYNDVPGADNPGGVAGGGAGGGAGSVNESRSRGGESGNLASRDSQNSLEGPGQDLPGETPARSLSSAIPPPPSPEEEALSELAGDISQVTPGGLARGAALDALDSVMDPQQDGVGSSGGIAQGPPAQGPPAEDQGTDEGVVDPEGLAGDLGEGADMNRPQDMAPSPGAQGPPSAEGPPAEGPPAERPPAEGAPTTDVGRSTSSRPVFDPVDPGGLAEGDPLSKNTAQRQPAAAAGGKSGGSKEPEEASGEDEDGAGRAKKLMLIVMIISSIGMPIIGTVAAIAASIAPAVAIYSFADEVLNEVGDFFGIGEDDPIDDYKKILEDNLSDDELDMLKNLEDDVKRELDCSRFPPQERRPDQNCIENLLTMGESGSGAGGEEAPWSPVPPESAWLVDIWKKAGKRYSVPWEVIGGINAARTNFGLDVCNTRSVEREVLIDADSALRKRKSGNLLTSGISEFWIPKNTRKETRQISVPDGGLGFYRVPESSWDYNNTNAGYDNADDYTACDPVAGLGSQYGPGGGNEESADSDSGEYTDGGPGPVPVKIMRILMANGYDKAAAAGITGNAWQESSYNPESTDGSGNGGLWGFTSPPVSLGNLQSFARSKNKSWKDVGIQTMFLMKNINIHDSNFKKRLNRIKTPEKAAEVFCLEWERPAPATADIPDRKRAAREIFRDIDQAESAQGGGSGNASGNGSVGEAQEGLGGVQGTGITKSEVRSVRGHIYAGNKVTPGTYEATAYGPPWNAMQGSGTTSTGISLGSGNKKYLVAIDPSLNNYGKFVYIWPNPFNWGGPFLTADTGGAIQGRRIDFYDWRGRQSQNGWGRKDVKLSSSPIEEGAGVTGSTGAESSARYAYPLSRRGPICCDPADHRARAMGNWMSDKAVDIMVPPNTPVRAVDDSVVTRLSGSAPNPAANPAGWTVYLRSKVNGDEYAYMHLNSYTVKEGDQLQKGEVFGKSGTANSADHLHFASLKVNPMVIVGEAALDATSGVLPGGQNLYAPDVKIFDPFLKPIKNIADASKELEPGDPYDAVDASFAIAKSLARNGAWKKENWDDYEGGSYNQCPVPGFEGRVYYPPIQGSSSTGTITAGLDDPQKREFAENMAAESGMSLRVIATWVQSEGGNQFGDNNWLNIGHTDSGPAGVTRAPEWRKANTAGRTAAKWMDGKWGSKYNYVAAESIQKITQSKTKSDQEQIKAIAGSGWATSTEYLNLLQAVYKDIRVSSDSQNNGNGGNNAGNAGNGGNNGNETDTSSFYSPKFKGESPSDDVSDAVRNLSMDGSDCYVAMVKEWADLIKENPPAGASDSSVTLPEGTQKLTEPRKFVPIPDQYCNSGSGSCDVDARIKPNVMYLLEKYDMIMTQGRNGYPPSVSHNDGTGIDFVPRSPDDAGWDKVEAAAKAVGWRPDCGGSGSAPACPLVPAIKWVGYDGYSNHGRYNHLHISWASDCSTHCSDGVLVPPRKWVIIFGTDFTGGNAGNGAGDNNGNGGNNGGGNNGGDNNGGGNNGGGNNGGGNNGGGRGGSRGGNGNGGGNNNGGNPLNLPDWAQPSRPQGGNPFMNGLRRSMK